MMVNNTLTGNHYYIPLSINNMLDGRMDNVDND